MDGQNLKKSFLKLEESLLFVWFPISFSFLSFNSFPLIFRDIRRISFLLRFPFLNYSFETGPLTLVYLSQYFLWPIQFLQRFWNSILVWFVGFDKLNSFLDIFHWAGDQRLKMTSVVSDHNRNFSASFVSWNETIRQSNTDGWVCSVTGGIDDQNIFFQWVGTTDNYQIPKIVQVPNACVLKLEPSIIPFTFRILARIVGWLFYLSFALRIPNNPVMFRGIFQVLNKTVSPIDVILYCLIKTVAICLVGSTRSHIDSMFFSNIDCSFENIVVTSRPPLYSLRVRPKI